MAIPHSIPSKSVNVLKSVLTDLTQIIRPSIAQLRRVDSSIFFIVLFLSLVGIAFLLISSFSLSIKYTGDPLFFVKRQIFWLVLSLLTILVFTLTPLTWFYRNSEKISLFIVILLISVFIPYIGKSVNNARRWTNLGVLPFYIQPSEFIKPFFLIVFAQLIHSKTSDTEQKKRFFLIGFMLFITMLVALQPDLSTSTILITTSVLLLLINSFTLKYFFITSIVTLPIWLWIIQSKQYITSRFLFLNPETDPYGSGYHIIRSLSAHRSGGWLGQETEEAFINLAKLPDAHNDFAFASLTQISGFVGALLVIATFMLLLDRGIRIGKAQKDPKNATLAYSIIFMISIETLLHIAVTLGAVPTTGTPLPFISYGGSSLLTHYIMIGILLNLSRSNQKSIDSPLNSPLDPPTAQNL